MKIGIVSSVFLMALSVIAPLAPAGDKAASSAARRLEALKELAGDWVEIGKDGKPTDHVVSSFHVIAGGSAVQETLFPGTEKEMVTMYHLDGSDLVLTHYCTLGNQPRMKAEPGDDDRRIVFKFSGGTNLKSDGDLHMDHGTLTLVDKHHIRAHWTACKEGTACHDCTVDLARKSK
ncbi:MAG: hypothetical protein ACYC61_15965 [Isosphaeraceae bacterium]